MQVFLKKVVAEHPVFDGIRLSTNLGSSWRVERVDPPARMRSGDWVLYDQKQEGEEFELYFWTNQSSQITIQARRLAKDQFVLLGIKRDDVVKLSSRNKPNQTPQPTPPSRRG